MKNAIEIHGLTIDDGVCACEAVGLSKVWAAYAEHCAGEPITEVGFNANSGNVYIGLENGVIICSCMGQDVKYIVQDFMTSEEPEFDSYEAALAYAGGVTE